MSISNNSLFKYLIAMYNLIYNIFNKWITKLMEIKKTPFYTIHYGQIDHIQIVLYFFIAYKWLNNIKDLSLKEVNTTYLSVVSCFWEKAKLLFFSRF